jgi:hypothetical protein
MSAADLSNYNKQHDCFKRMLVAFDTEAEVAL